MSIRPRERNQEEEEEEEEEEDFQAAAHHPSAPSHELFDISTTVDPSYIISLIRKLLPSNVKNENNSHEGGDNDMSAEGPQTEGNKKDAVCPSENGGAQLFPNSEAEAMDTVDNSNDLDGRVAIENELHHNLEHQGRSVGEEAWEQYGCTLWDLVASETHAEFMAQNLILEVLSANLVVSHSARITEICLGIIGNLACHEVPRKRIASTNGLIETILDQLFSDDAPCLCEASRLITLCLQGAESVLWAEALKSENILSRILWIVENTLNPQLLEKSVGLLLAISESQQEVASVLLPSLVKLGLPSMMINLLGFEMSKLKEDRMPERYSVLDLILRTIEALSVLDDYSQEVCSNKELFQLLNNLIKLPDKIEVASSCISAAVLIANILTDAPDLGSEISNDILFLQGLFEIFPFASDDAEARSALWSILARLLSQVKESEISPSRLHQYVFVLTSKSELIEEELLDHDLDSKEEHKSSTSGAILRARLMALKRISDILRLWTTSKDHARESGLEEDSFSEEDVDKLLDCCQKYATDEEILELPRHVEMKKLRVILRWASADLVKRMSNHLCLCLVPANCLCLKLTRNASLDDLRPSFKRVKEGQEVCAVSESFFDGRITQSSFRRGFSLVGSADNCDSFTVFVGTFMCASHLLISCLHLTEKVKKITSN